MIIARRINERFNLGANHIYFFHQGDWYHHLERFPGILVDTEGYVRFETQDEYENNPNLQHGQRLHIRDGIKSLQNYVRFSEEQLFILNQIRESNNIDPVELDNNNQAERRPRNIDSIVRNQTLVRRVKRLRDNRCQICSNKLQIGPNSYYSEVHHIQPLGNPHNGPDIIENMLCVCPNCHKKLDYGFIRIGVEILNLRNHRINQQYIDYHNDRI